MVGTEAYSLYRKLINNPEPEHSVIGKGESAAITLAKEYHAILASNNFKDISQYVEEYSLINFKTSDIMKMALDSSYITEAQGNKIWAERLKRRSKLDYETFSEYLSKAIMPVNL